MSRTISLCNAGSGRHSKIFVGSVAKHIGVVVYDGFSLLGMGTLTATLHTANELRNAARENCPTYSVSLVSASGGIIASSSSICMCTECLSEDRSHEFDALYVSGGTGVTRASADDKLIQLLETACSQGVEISALGSGHELLTAARLSCATCAELGRARSIHDSSYRPRDERTHALMHSLALVKRDFGYDFASLVSERLFESQHDLSC